MANETYVVYQAHPFAVPLATNQVFNAETALRVQCCSAGCSSYCTAFGKRKVCV